MTQQRMRLRLLAGVVAVFSAGIGIGGGAILVPALIRIGKFDFRRASGLSLATIAPISLVGAVTHVTFLDGVFPIRILAAFIAAGAVGVAAGNLMLERVPTPAFSFVFAAFLVVVGFKMATGWHLVGISLHAIEGTLACYPCLAIACFGVIVGLTSSLLGVGCGLVIVPFCVYGLSFDIHVAIAFSLAAMFFLTSAGTLGRMAKGTFDLPTASIMIPASLVGAALGASLSSQLPDALLRQAFGVFLLLLGTRQLVENVSHVLAKRTEHLCHANPHD